MSEYRRWLLIIWREMDEALNSFEKEWGYRPILEIDIPTMEIYYECKDEHVNSILRHVRTITHLIELAQKHKEVDNG